MPSTNDMDLFTVPGLVAVISGGGTGIGLMMARALASNGAKRIFIIGRRLDKLQEAAEGYDNITPVQGDVTDKAPLEDIASQVESEVGYVNLLIVNAGMTGPMVSTQTQQSSSIQDFQREMWAWSTEEFNSVYALNNTAAFFTATAFLTLLDAGKEPGKGPDYQSQILFTSSLAGFARRISTGVAYSTSKAATAHLAKSMSTSLAGYGVRVNALAPGIFLTEMTQGHVGSAGGFSVETIPAKRMGSEEDVRGMILWLAGRAGAYVNGMVILLDGGRLSQQPATY